MSSVHKNITKNCNTDEIIQRHTAFDNAELYSFVDVIHKYKLKPGIYYG